MSLELLLERAVKAGAINGVRYPAYVNSENFPETQVRGTLSIVSFAGLGMSLSQFHYCGDVIDAMSDLGFLPGTMSELITYSSSWNGKTPVLALGSIWREAPRDYYAGCLCRTADGPELSLRDIDFGWNDNDRFLVIRY
ncbi:MAG: hypothetical protein NVSMB39_5510 [Candidatus Saccharimonadales bacterium]